MYQKIMVPLDGSEVAECVLPHVGAFITGPQSWAWKFETDNLPAKLLRKTWWCLN